VGTNLNGTLSRSIGNLTHLRILNIAGNPNLTGGLPQEIGNLTGLVILELNDNNFTVPLPDLSNLKNLQTLDLSGNSLHGAIPAWIGGLTLLQRVDLSGNKFQGNIPFASNGSNATSYNLPYVVEISLGDNNLSGLLPDLHIFHSLRKL
jgi:Leucine-rich repeat (LRR) protein